MMSIRRVLLSVIPEAIKQKRNIIIPTTGLREYIVRLSKLAKENGYYVKIAHIKIDKLKAMQRAIDRYEKEKRLIDPYFIAIRAPYLDNQLSDFLNSDLVDEIDIINYNNIPKNFTEKDIIANTIKYK